MKKRLLGALLISLMLLTACSSSPPDVRTVTVTKIQYVFPPKELISQCIVPPYSSKKNQDLSEYTNSLMKVISLCDLDWLSLENWINEQKSKLSAE